MPFNSGVGDVGAVKEGKEVAAAQNWNQAEINLEKQFSRCMLVFMKPFVEATLRGGAVECRWFSGEDH
jgi:hypothetical protein